MGQHSVPDEVMELIKANTMTEGQTIKVVHQYEDDGTPCSLHKSAALAVTRRRGGWVWWCHRCRCRGGLKEIMRSGDQIREYLESAKVSESKPLRPDEKIALPSDTVQIVAKDLVSTNRGIPWDVLTWLLKSNITKQILDNRFIGWSPYENRVIFPITTSEYTTDGKFTSPELVGWVGRDPIERDKETRVELGIPKYITRKAGGHDRIVYSAIPHLANTNVFAIVEDIASALHVSYAANCPAFAILSTDVPRKLLDKLTTANRNAPIVLWLDDDMHAKMIQETAKLRSLGYDIKFVRTHKDPKYYNYAGIRLMLKQRFSIGE